MTKDEFKELIQSAAGMDAETRKNKGIYYISELPSMGGNEKEKIKYLLQGNAGKILNPRSDDNFKNLLAVEGDCWISQESQVPKLECITGNCLIHSGVTAESLQWTGGDCSLFPGSSAPALTKVEGNCSLKEDVKAPQLETVGGHCNVGYNVEVPNLYAVQKSLTVDEGAKVSDAVFLADSNLLRVFDPESYLKGRDFQMAEKSQRIEARPGVPGEKVETILADGTKETKNVAKDGDMVVNNVGSPEKWIVDRETFKKKYQVDPEHPGQYKPTGKPMRAYKLDADVSIVAPWGEEQTIKKGGYLLQDPENPKDTYGIGKDEFEKTYRPSVKKEENTQKQKAQPARAKTGISVMPTSDGKISIHTPSGEWMKVDGISEMSEGFHVIKKDGKFNYMNKDGELLTKNWLDSASMFKDGVAKIKLGNARMEINKEGTILKKTVEVSQEIQKGMRI